MPTPELPCARGVQGWPHPGGVMDFPLCISGGFLGLPLALLTQQAAFLGPF